MFSAPCAFGASRDSPDRCERTFLLRFVLLANVLGGNLCLGNEDGGDVCGHRSDLASRDAG